MPNDRRGRLQTEAHEMVKQYLVYDGSGRVTDVYTAHTDAVDGTPCSRTRYSYDGVSSRIEKRKEQDATWDSSWDMA